MFTMIYKDDTQEVWLPTMLVDIINQRYNKAYKGDKEDLSILIHEAMSYVRSKVICLGAPVVSAQIFRISRNSDVRFAMTDEGQCFSDALELISLAFDRTEGEVTRDWADELEDIIYEHYHNEYGVNCYAHLMEEPLDNVNYFIAINKGKDTFILFIELNELDIWHDITEEFGNE